MDTKEVQKIKRRAAKRYDSFVVALCDRALGHEVDVGALAKLSKEEARKRLENLKGQVMGL